MTINLDNAATAGYRPETVVRAVADAILNAPANPGRSGHSLSLKAARIVFDCREAVAKLFGAKDAENIFFTRNATEAINLALFGFLGEGDRVILTSFEHNSVMRPLDALSKSRGVTVGQVRPGSGGALVDLSDLEAKLASGPALVVMMLASNVTGRKLAVAEVADACRRRGVPLMIDGAQGAGSVAMDLESSGVDLFAFTGHKDLFGPQGTGGLWARNPERLTPLVFGGTGSGSESTGQPEVLPDRFESGTANVPGLAGLAEGVRFVLENGAATIGIRKAELAARLHERLAHVPGIEFPDGFDPLDSTGVLSFTVKGMTPDRIGRPLDREFGILCRPGLHCAPIAHRTLGTFPSGTVRLSVSFFNTVDEMDAAADAIASVVTAAGNLVEP